MNASSNDSGISIDQLGNARRLDVGTKDAVDGCMSGRYRRALICRSSASWIANRIQAYLDRVAQRLAKEVYRTATTGVAPYLLAADKSGFMPARARFCGGCSPDPSRRAERGRQP